MVMCVCVRGMCGGGGVCGVWEGVNVPPPPCQEHPPVITACLSLLARVLLQNSTVFFSFMEHMAVEAGQSVRTGDRVAAHCSSCIAQLCGFTVPRCCGGVSWERSISRNL